MNFAKIFAMQKQLDQAILTAHNVRHEDVREKRVVALLVEVGEFANEYSPFKYWKKQINIDRAKLLEEFVDGIHFLSSLTIDMGDDVNPIVHAEVTSQDLTHQLLETFNAIAGLKYKFDKEQLRKAFSVYMGNARLLGFTNDEIEEFYVNKNEENFNRIARGY